MIASGGSAQAMPLRPTLIRAAGLLITWLILSGGGAADLLPGLPAAAVATAISLRLLPQAKHRVAPLALAGFALRFLGQSVVAGADVARRALDFRLPLRPGFVVYPTSLPPSPARSMFAMLMSLLPGTVPVGSGARGGMLIHCLDVEQPVVAQLAAEEERFLEVIGRTGEGRNV